MAEEKRSYSRVATNIKANLRRLSSSDSRPSYLAVQGMEDFTELEELRKSNLPDVVVDFMVHLDRKLDMLLNVFSRDMLSKDFPLSVEVTEISGAGLKFRSKDDFGLDEHVEIVVHLGQMPLKMAGAVGRVSRLEGTEDDKVWVLDFTSIRDKDLEAVVQFVFQEQRSQIREQKWA